MEQKSQLINGPQESSINGSSSTPWKGRLRFSNIVDGSSQTSSKNLHVDDESSDLEKNMSEESRILSITTLGARMTKKTLKHLTTTMEYEDPHESSTLYKDSHMMAL